ncbi:unnamed protein product, partial [Staurois parvus]
WGPWAIGDHGAPVSLPTPKKAYETVNESDVSTASSSLTRFVCQHVVKGNSCLKGPTQGWTDNSWGPWAIGDHGAPVSLPKLKKAYEKSTRGISWGPLLSPGPQAVPEFPNGQSTPESH